MKITISIVTLLALALTLVGAGLIYPSTMEIISIQDDEVYLITATGHVFAMTGAEDYEVGDLVSLIMFSNGTPFITDDEIISARYSGYNMSEEVIEHE